MARLHRANAAKSEFGGHVSHELRNSIHAVGLVHQSLLDGALPKPQRDQIRVAQENLTALPRPGVIPQAGMGQRRSLHDGSDRPPAKPVAARGDGEA